MRIVFSSCVRKEAVSGELGSAQGIMTPISTVKMPSRIKIQRHPPRPAIPSICWIPKARRPEKLPAREAAEKKIATRV
jgi:hypothetical protein